MKDHNYIFFSKTFLVFDFNNNGHSCCPGAAISIKINADAGTDASWRALITIIVGSIVPKLKQ